MLFCFKFQLKALLGKQANCGSHSRNIGSYHHSQGVVRQTVGISPTLTCTVRTGAVENVFTSAVSDLGSANEDKPNYRHFIGGA